MNFHKNHFFNKIKLYNKKYDSVEKTNFTGKATFIVILLWIISFIITFSVLASQVILVYNVKTMEYQCYIYMLSAEHKIYNDPSLVAMLGKYSNIFQTDTNNYLAWLKAHPRTSVQVIEAQYTAYVEQLRQVQILSHLTTQYKAVFSVLYPSLNADYIAQITHINAFYDLLMCLPLFNLLTIVSLFTANSKSDNSKIDNASSIWITFEVLVGFAALLELISGDPIISQYEVQWLLSRSTTFENAGNPSYASSLNANLALIGYPSLSTAGFLSQINLPFVLINGTNANTTVWVNIMAQTSLKANFLNSPLYYALTTNNLTNIGAAIIDNNRQLLDANITCNLYNFVASLPGNLGQLFFGVPTIIY